jgi:RNA polymerase sigma factor (sigma-70 family)
MRDHLSIPDLVAAARDGDKAAWDELVERFAPLVWSVCRRFRLSDADTADVGQAVWLYLVEQLPVLREPAALPGWLATTTRRECLRVVNAGRKRERREVAADFDLTLDSHAPDVDEWLLEEERNVAIRAAFAELPPRCQQLLLLLLRDPPLHYTQIGAEMGMQVGGIGPTRARCLEKMRRSPALAALIDASTVKRGRSEGHDRSMVER